MSRRDQVLANSTALLEQTNSQPPNISHNRLTDITGMPKSTVLRFMQQDEELSDEWVLREGQQGKSLNQKNEEKDQEFEKTLNQLFCTVTERGVLVCGPMLISQRNVLTRWRTRTEEQQMVGCLDANIGIPLG
jgi:hypothetical protein